MEIFLKPLTEASSYIFLSGIFMIILGALIGITPPDSRKTLHTSLAIPLFIAVGLVYIFRSFDFLVEIGGFIKINSYLKLIIIFCGVELGRRNIENAYGKKPFSPLWYILLLFSFIYLTNEYTYADFVILSFLIMLAKLFAVIVTIKAAKILPDYNRISIRGAFIIAFFGAIIHFFNDLPFAYLHDGHYKPLDNSAIYLYYVESILFFIISIIIIGRRFTYEKSQRLHRLNTLSLISPVVVYVTSIMIALGVFIGSNLITQQERVKQNYESQSYNLNIKNAIKQRIDLAMSSARLMAQSPTLPKYLSKPDNNEVRESVKSYLVSLNDKNPGLSIFLADSQGNILVSSEIKPVHEGINIASRDYFIDGLDGVSSLTIYRENSDDKFGFYIDYPVHSIDKQQILGVFIFKIELDDLENLIKLNHYPTMIVDLKDNGRIMVANNKIFIDQNCGDIRQYVDKGTQPIDNIPILSMMTKHSAFFSLASFGDYPYGVLSLSNVDQSATTQVWLLFIALLITFILYLVLYGIAYNSENMKTIESAQSNFQLIFNHTPDPICVISEETTEILAVNKSMQKCFGYEESLVGKKLDDLIVNTSKLEYHSSLSDEVSISECRFKKLSGDIFTAEITASNIDYASKKAVLLNIHDISIFKVIEEKLTEAKNSAEEANQIKSRLLANASHELRTPMTAIIGLTELAVSICNDDNQKQIIELLRISSKSLMSLINDMFNLTEVQNGKVIIKNSAFKLNSLLDEVKEYVSFLAKRDKKDIVFRNLTTLPDIVIADLDHIRQSLLAVIDYISDICVNNNTLVNIDFNEVSKSSGQLIVIISGIDEDKREEIEKSIDNDIDYADPYHASVTRKFASGISLHSMILRTMKGYIQIDSQSVIPNTIALKMVIPVELTDSGSSGLSNISEEQYFYYKGKPLNLLVADDNDVNLFFVESVIKRFKGKCNCVKDGIEVLEELKKSEYDGILLDIQMPKKDGKITLKEIRSMSGPLSKIPVIAVSAFASEEEKNKILAAGAQKYLGKPFFPNDLYEAISSVFELDKTLPAEEIKTEDKGSLENKDNKETTDSTNNKKVLTEKLKRINYREFEIRLAPNSKTIVKLEEIYNRRCSALNIEVDNCIYNDDAAKLREVAHSIKGLVGMMAADESWQIAKDIEQKAGEGNLKEAISKISELRIHLAEISADLEIIKELLK